VTKSITPCLLVEPFIFTNILKLQWTCPYTYYTRSAVVIINSWSTLVLVILCLVLLPLHARLTSLDTWTSPFGPGSRPLCEHIPRARTLLNSLLNMQLLTKLSCEPYLGVWLLGLLKYGSHHKWYVTDWAMWVIRVGAQNPRFPVVGHRTKLLLLLLLCRN